MIKIKWCEEEGPEASICSEAAWVIFGLRGAGTCQNSWEDSPPKPDIPMSSRHLLAPTLASWWSFLALGEVLSGCLLHLATSQLQR